MIEEKRKIIFIINPVAGKGKTIEILPKLKELLEYYKSEVNAEIKISSRIGEISNITSEYYALGYREFVAVGGDGSLSELINGLKFPTDEPVKIGIIPLGTGNDFIKNISEDVEVDKVLNSIFRNQTKIIDIGKVNNHYFINVCSFGIDGPIIQDTEKFKKLMPGKSAYLFSTLKAGMTFKPSKVKVSTSNESYEGFMILIAIGNGKYFGGGMKICPDACLSDGLFDVCLVKDVRKGKFMRNISKVYSGRLGEIKEVKYIRSDEILIQVIDEEYWVNVDGNLVGKTPVSIKIIKNAISVFV